MNHFTETLVLDEGAGVRRTNDGYLLAQPRVARTGVQLYPGSEIGIQDKAIAGIMRPAEVVFDNASLKSYANKPVTMGHPPSPVDAANWRDHAVGQTGGEVLRDGEYVRVPLMLTDQAAIDRVLAGDAVELSLGYYMDLDYTAGDGYDAVAKSIRANHLAIVEKARGGPQLNILEDEDMPNPTTTPVILDGMTVQVADQSNAQLVQRYADQAEARIKALDEKKVELEATIAKMTKDGEETAKKVEELEKAVKDAEMTPEKLDALVTDAARVREVARKVLGADAKLDGQSAGDIRKAVVLHQMGDTAKAYDDAAFKTAFDVLAKDIPSGGGGGMPTATATGDGASRSLAEIMGGAGSAGGNGSLSVSDEAYQDMIKDMMKRNSAHYTIPADETKAN